MIVCLLALVAYATAASVDIPCDTTRQVFSQLNHGSTVRVPHVPVHRPPLNLCDRYEKSCCVPEMERVYARATESSLNDTILTSIGAVRMLLEESAKVLEAKLKDLLSYAENATLDVLADVHRISVPREAVHGFFQAVMDTVLDRTTSFNISSRTRDLFSSLYPSLLSGGAAGLPSDFRQCVQKAYDQNEPFGKLPTLLAEGLERTADAVSSVIDALKRGSEVLKNAQMRPLPKNCVPSLTRLIYCSHCVGFTSLKFCSSTCKNVAGSCLAPLAPLEPSLLGYSQALSQLSLASTEQELRSLDTRISQALVFGMESAPDQEHKLLELCGSPKYTPGSGEPTTHAPSPTNRHWDLDGTLLTAQQRVSQLSLSSLPTDVCEDDTRSDGDWCWNGSVKIPVNGADRDAGDLLPSLPTNPQVEPDVQLLVTQLEAATSILVSKVSVLPKPQFQADQSSDFNSGEGSGSPHPGFDDDEDYTGGDSGSGSLPDDDTTAETVTPPSPPVSPQDFDFNSETDKKARPGSAGGKMAASSILVSFALVLLTIYRL